MSSSIARSPSRLTAPRSGIPSKANQLLIPAPRSPVPPVPKTPVIKASKPASYPSKLPKSPGLKSVTKDSAEPPKNTSTPKISPAPVPKSSKKTPVAGSTALKTSTHFSNPSKSPRTPDPKIKVTVSPPHAPLDSPEMFRTRRVDSAMGFSQVDKPLELVPKESSPYIAAHIGDPCTLKALDHVLECGHKVITTQPESCASNCRSSYSAHVNPKLLDQPFACLTCIVSKQQKKYAERVASFTSELKEVAKATKKPDPEHWVALKVGIMQKAWKDLENEETIAEAKEGRFAYPVYIDPEYEQVMVAVVGERLRSKARAQVAAALAITK